LSLQVFKRECFADAQCLTINLIDTLAALVLDPKITADGDQLLAHLVACGGATATKSRPLISAIPHIHPPCGRKLVATT
jgi:hypothetical protein